jgi:asparagine synthase (glutamine-hydrolysing)
MCGIAAAVGWIDAEVARAVRAMNDSQRLRGPDASGEWSTHGPEAAPGEGVHLAFRRLKIIDLRDSANQPMLDPVTQNRVIFNGEIYNYRELRDELRVAGHEFRTESDTEVLLKAYAQWGSECLRKLRGMFAFAIWDTRQRTVLVARDRLGIKPLFTAVARHDGGRKTLLLASQLRALLASGLVERRLDASAVSSYLWNGFVAGPSTIVEGIRVLPPGCLLQVSLQGESEQRRYWSVPQPSTDGNPGAVAESLEVAIGQHLLSDVPLGVFLSGGKDSSSVAAMASRKAGKGLKTFTIAFEESSFNEAPHARQLAAAIGAEHHELMLTEADFASRLEAALSSLDQPTFDGINSYFVSHAVKEAGITVALAGTGGDELFGGYRTFRDLPRARRWSRRLKPVPIAAKSSAAGLLARLRTGNFSAVPPLTRHGRLGDALRTEGELVDLYQVAYALFSTPFLERLDARGALPTTSYGLPQERRAELAARFAGFPDLHAISALEIEVFLGDRLLRDTDSASMEVSLEVRLPLLDHVVVERLFELPAEQRFLPLLEKSLLTEIAAPPLPRDSLQRPKMGFELPLERWCRNAVGRQIESVLLDRGRCEAVGVAPRAVSDLWSAYQKRVPGLYWSRVWSIFVLLWWCQRHALRST